MIRLVRELDGFLGRSSVKTIFEIGSRDLEVSLGLSRAYPRASVYAFECNPDCIQICRKNLKKDRSGRIHLVERAVCDTDGTVDFWSIDPEKTKTRLADGNIGASSLYQANPEYPSEKYAQRKINVEATTLASFMAGGVPAPDLLWMDVQGAELKVFQGMGPALQTVKAVYTEVDFRPVYLGQPLFTQVHDHLIANGFFLYDLKGWKWFGDALYLNCSLNRRRRSWFERLGF